MIEFQTYDLRVAKEKGREYAQKVLLVSPDDKEKTMLLVRSYMAGYRRGRIDLKDEAKAIAKEVRRVQKINRMIQAEAEKAAEKAKEKEGD